jgi:NAD(P)-dependent dehydrogenase (short-subunit alcohol dehydrogenase family)
MKVTDVNFNGSIYFARIASVCLRQSPSSDTSKSTDRSLTLVSSVAGILELSSLFVYSASKHGVIGLMRSLRKLVLYFFSYILTISLST